MKSSLSIILLFQALLVGCAVPHNHQVNTSGGVRIVGDKEFLALTKRLSIKNLSKHTYVKGYETWEAYHKSLWKVAGAYGSVGLSDEADFYHSGNWHHELFDGFEVRSLKGVSSDALQRFQAAVKQHHPEAVLSLSADINTPFVDLNILVTSTVIYASWGNSSANECRRNLRTIGVDLEQH